MKVELWETHHHGLDKHTFKAAFFLRKLMYRTEMYGSLSCLTVN